MSSTWQETKRNRVKSGVESREGALCVANHPLLEKENKNKPKKLVDIMEETDKLSGQVGHCNFYFVA